MVYYHYGLIIVDRGSKVKVVKFENLISYLRRTVSKIEIIIIPLCRLFNKNSNVILAETMVIRGGSQR